MKSLAFASILVLASPAIAFAADCPAVKGSVRVLSNDFSALHAVVDQMGTCASSGLSFSKNQNKDFLQLEVAAEKANPAVYTSVFIANGSITPLLNEGLLRPLDTYVAKYGQGLKKNQLISIDGKVMAIAYMINAQHLYYRQDILEKAGVAVPKTYEDVLAAAQTIKSKGLLQYPLTGTYQAGWNLGEEFVNMLGGYGGSLFKAGSAEPDIANAKGAAALTMLKSLSAYMNPDYLTLDSNGAAAEWKSGSAAMMVMWGSRAPDIFAATNVASLTKVAGAPTVGGGTSPATTLWWDGFSIAKNISDEDADATFAVAMHGISPDMVKANNDMSIWLIDGYKPGPTAQGVLASAEGGAAPYPSYPYVGLLHTAIGNEVPAFMQGRKTADQALADAEAAYRTAARQAGYLK